MRNRTRKTEKGNFKEATMREAVALVKGGMSLRKAAEQKHIAFQTLARYVKKQEQHPDEEVRMRPFYECRKIFTEAQEESLAEYILKSSKMFYGITAQECRRLAYEMCKVNRIACPQKWTNEQTAGIEWFRGFMKRNKHLALRTPEGCSLARATSFNPHNVKVFYDNLKNILQREPKFCDGTRIFNLDETGTTTVHKPPRVIAEKGSKQVSKCTSGEKGVLVTTCCIISATGNTVPPAMIFPRVHFKEHMLHGAPSGTLGLANKTGWMNGELFTEVIDHFIYHSKSSKDHPSLLIYDNHESHLSITVLDKAKENGVTILTLPPHSSNKMQPLDVGVYKPFKTYYNQAMDNWMMANPGKPISIYEIASCVGIAHQKAMTPNNITEAFKKTGIFPYDADIFSEADFLSSSVTDRPDPTGNNDDSADNATTSTCHDNLLAQVEDASEHNGETSATTDQNNMQENFIPPAEFRGYPKAVERKNSSKGRAKGKSIIATDTPVKDALKEKASTRKSANDTMKRTRPPSKSTPKPKKKLFEINENPVEDSEESDNSEEPELYDTDEDDIIEADPLSEVLKDTAHEGDYVLSEFKTQKNNKIYYIGKVIKEKDEDGDYEISFLQASKKMVGKFVLPSTPKIEVTNEQCLKMILPQPKVYGKTKRQMSHYTFEVDFRNMDVR